MLCHAMPYLLIITSANPPMTLDMDVVLFVRQIEVEVEYNDMGGVFR